MSVFARRGERIYFQNQPARWHDVVQYSVPNHMDVLAQYSAMRKQIVDNLLRQVVRDIGCVTCNWQSVGGVNPTSDYDLSVYGPDADQVVSEFNRQFRETYGCESGEMFDTNIYGFPLVSPDLTLFHHLMIGTQEYEYIANPVDPALNKVNTFNQHVWACVKWLLYLTPQEQRYAVSKVTGSWAPAVKHAYDRLTTELHKLDLKQSNLQYAALLHRVSELRKQLAAGDRNEQSIVKYIEAMSLANFYGAETYFTQGPFLHVVVQNQMNATNVPIPRAAYMDSFVENMGDCFKLLPQDNPAATHCEHTVVDMSKYWSRALDALQHAQEGPLTAQQQQLLAESHHVYKNVRGKLDRVDRDTIQRHVSSLLSLSNLRTCDLGDLRAELLQFTIVQISLEEKD